MSKETKETKVTNPTIEWRVPKPKNKVELIPQAEAAARQSAIELNRQIVYIRSLPHEGTRNKRGEIIPAQNHITLTWTHNPHIPGTGYQGHVYLDESGDRVLEDAEVYKQPHKNPEVWPK